MRPGAVAVTIGWLVALSGFVPRTASLASTACSSTPPERPGDVGYLLADTVRLRRDGVLLTSAQSPRKATLIDAPTLASE